MKSKHPVMNIKLVEGQAQLTITNNAFMYLQDRRIIKLKLIPFADWKTRFVLYLNLALKTGESYMMCMRSCFDEKMPKSVKDYARGQDPTHYYHQMPNALA